MVQCDDLLGFDDNELFFDFEQSNDFEPRNDDRNSFFEDSNDGVHPTMETEGDANVHEVMPPTTDQMADVNANLDSTERIPPLTVATPTITPLESDHHETEASQPPLKGRKADPRLGVLIKEQSLHVQQFTAAVTPAQPNNVDSIVLHEETNVVHSFIETGSSSALGPSSDPQLTHDTASERLARFLEQQYIDPAPQGKRISIGEGSSGGVYPSISELKSEIGVLKQKIIE